MTLKKTVLISLAVIIVIPIVFYVLLYFSAILCFLGGSLGSELSCVPIGVLSKVNENTRDSILFYQTQRKIKNQTADGVDNFLYAKMIWKEKDWLQSAQKINPSIPKDKLVDFYFEQSANMGYREGIGSYAKKLASDGTQEFIHGSHDKANQMYRQALSQVKTLIINGCEINSNIDIRDDFYTYKDKIGKSNKKLLDKISFVKEIVTDYNFNEPHNDENIKQATFIYMYDLINCNGDVNEIIRCNYRTYEEFKNDSYKKSRVLLYALEIVTKQDLNLPKPTNKSDIQKEQALKEKAMVFAQEYQNEFLKGKQK